MLRPAKVFYLSLSLVIALSISLAFTSTSDFEADYQYWIDPKNGFVVEAGNNKDQLRPLYAYGDFSSNPENTERLGTGKNPSVSEGLGYALLLSYAANDQISFDKFLRFVWTTTQQYGCRGQANDSVECQERVNLMPWMVNEDGKPFMTTGSGAMEGNASVNYSSGSAADSDFQIAWAVYLAANNSEWNQHSPSDLNYQEIFYSMTMDIAKFDINFNNNLMLPGASWYEEGEKTYFSGYYTPQAFDIFATVDMQKIMDANLTSSTPADIAPTDLIIVLNNTTSKKATAHTPDIYNGTWKNAPTDVEAHTASTFVFAGNADGAQAYVGWQQGAQAIPLCAETFVLTGSTWKSQGSTQVQCDLQHSGNQYTFTMYNRVIQDWKKVKEANLEKIQAFQLQYNLLKGLIPNIAEPTTMQTKYNDRYSYDATRYPLWSGAYLMKSCSATPDAFCDNLKISLKELNSYFKNAGVIQAGSLPADGYYYGPSSADINKSALAGPALNGPALVAAHALSDTEMITALTPHFEEYALSEHKHNPNILFNSSPYFEGTLLMLSKAAIEGKL